MVTWSADGKLGAFNPATNTFDYNMLTFPRSTSGTVDVNGITRYIYAKNTLYVRPSGSLDYSPIDVWYTGEKHPDLMLAATLFITEATDLLGIRPTPRAIRNAVRNGNGYAERSRNRYEPVFGPDLTNKPFVFSGQPLSQLKPGTKYWVAVIPTSVFTTGAYANGANAQWDEPIPNTDENVTGKALSFWTGRKPTTPKITAPAAGTVVAAATQRALTFTGGDADSVSGNPNDLGYKNRAGVQVQYSRLATPEDPDPEWMPMPVILSDASGLRKNAQGQDPGHYLFAAQGGATEFQTLASTNTQQMWLGSGNYAGHGGQMSLPAGQWRIRLRTFIFGHPYGDSYSGGLGNRWFETNVGQKTTPAQMGSLGLASDWSAPVSISITSQTPPPTPISPANGAAVTAGQPVTLRWLYRNTATASSTPPGPYPQAQRQVQIRRVGDLGWTLAALGPGTDHFLTVAGSLVRWGGRPADLPWSQKFVYSQDPYDVIPAPVLDETTDPATGAIQLSTPGDYTGSDKIGLALSADFSASPGVAHETITISGKASGVINDLDAFLVNEGTYTSYTVVSETGTGASSSYVTDRPWSLTVYANGPYDGLWIGLLSDVPGSADQPVKISIDALTITKSPPAIDLVSGNQYEWRVKVTDSQGGESDWSSVARFWAVPPVSDGTDGGVIPSETLEGATLGCGTHRVLIYKRGGTEFVGEVTNLTRVEWGRVRDDISQAHVDVTGWSVDCGALLSRLATWAYEMVIFRDNGFSVDRVWEGPLTLLTYYEGRVRLSARDAMAYASRRIIKNSINDTGEGATVVNRTVRILQTSLADRDPNILEHLTPINSADDAMQYRTSAAYSSTAWEEIDNMAANAGLDYTTVGRRIIVWGTRTPIGRLPEFRDGDLGATPIVSEYGMQFANRYAVSDGNGVWGEALREDPEGIDYGPVEMLSSSWASDNEQASGSTYSPESLDKIRKSFAGYAEQSIESRNPPPVVVRVPDNTTVNPDVPITIQHLIPGVAIPLRSTKTLREVRATQKLDSVKVVEEADRETITVTMSPFSRLDNDMTGEAE